MVNRKAKDRKLKRLAQNKWLSSYGRTANQVRKNKKRNEDKKRRQQGY